MSQYVNSSQNSVLIIFEETKFLVHAIKEVSAVNAIVPQGLNIDTIVPQGLIIDAIVPQSLNIDAI